MTQKHDWVRYADGRPRLVREKYYECRRCGCTWFGFEFVRADATECPQDELPGLQELVPGTPG